MVEGFPVDMQENAVEIRNLPIYSVSAMVLSQLELVLEYDSILQ